MVLRSGQENSLTLPFCSLFLMSPFSEQKWLQNFSNLYKLVSVLMLCYYCLFVVYVWKVIKISPQIEYLHRFKRAMNANSFIGRAVFFFLFDSKIREKPLQKYHKYVFNSKFHQKKSHEEK